MGGVKCKALAKHEYKLVLVNEIIVAVNCPLLQHADNIIKKSLRSMFSDKKSVLDKGGHFFACLNSQNIEDFVESKSVEKISNVAVNVPFMCYYDKIYLLGTYDVIFSNKKTCLPL